MSSTPFTITNIGLGTCVVFFSLSTIISFIYEREKTITITQTHTHQTQILFDVDAMLSLRCVRVWHLKNHQGEQPGKSDEDVSGISTFPRCDLVSVLSSHCEYSMDVCSRESSHVGYGWFDFCSNVKSRCNALRLSLGEESVRQDLKCR